MVLQHAAGDFAQNSDYPKGVRRVGLFQPAKEPITTDALR
jgi:hypothetical protein